MAHCIGARTELSTSTRRRPASRPGPPAAPPLHGVVPGPPANVERHDAGPKGIAASAYGVPCSWTWTDPHTRQRPSSPTPARADWSRALGWPADALSLAMDGAAAPDWYASSQPARGALSSSSSPGGRETHIGLHGRRKTKAHQETHLATLPRFYNAGGKQGQASQPGTTRPRTSLLLLVAVSFAPLLFCVGGAVAIGFLSSRVLMYY